MNMIAAYLLLYWVTQGGPKKKVSIKLSRNCIKSYYSL